MLTLTEFCRAIDVPEDKIKGRSRKPDATIPRELYWLYLHSNGCSYRKIARLDGGRAAETILSGIKTIKNLIETNDPLIHPFKNFIQSFSHQGNSM